MRERKIRTGRWKESLALISAAFQILIPVFAVIILTVLVGYWLFLLIFG